MNKKAFTLVELIVVVTILAILGTIGFVSYSGYLTGVRDANRISQLTAISDGLGLYGASNSLPIPDDSVDITSDGTTLVGYQGYAGTTVLETIGYSKPGLDPKDKVPFTYYVNKSRKYHQLMAFLEESENLQAYHSLFTQAHAADLTNRYPTVYGNKLGIIVDTDNNPIQEAAASVDLSQTATNYTAHFSDDNSFTGSGAQMIAKVNLQINYVNSFLPDDISSLFMWFDASDISTIDTNVSDEITAWRDKSRKGNHFTTIGGNPTHSDYKINGKKTVYFDGNDSSDTTATFDAPYTIIFAVQMEGTGNGRVLGGTLNKTVGFHGGSKNDIYIGGWINTSTTSPDTNSELMSFSRDASNNSSFYNNGENISLSAPTAGSSLFGILSLGGSYNSEFSKVYIMEVLVYNRVLGESERQKVESYLNVKWGGF